MIDVSKIRVGDEVTVRATVLEVADGIKPIRVKRDPWVEVGEIATHTPAPREFKPGDRVTMGSGCLDLELIAIRDEVACVWDNISRRFESAIVHRLRHADESE
jgi:acyl dehydratase